MIQVSSEGVASPKVLVFPEASFFLSEITQKKISHCAFKTDFHIKFNLHFRIEHTSSWLFPQDLSLDLQGFVSF